jgi:phosphopantetheinyl transferase
VSLRTGRRAEAHPEPGDPARADAPQQALDLHVYYALTADIGDAELAELPPGDLEPVPREARAARRIQHLAGRALLRTALEDVTGRPASEHEIRMTSRGKPECAGGPSISISHSGPWVACAVAAASTVGIDVQAPVPGRMVESIAREYFGPAESEWVGAQPESFYMLWVLKEAYLKALGLGLAGGLRTLQCRVAPPAIEVVAARTPAPTSLRLYALDTAFVGVATVTSPCGDAVCRRWNPGGAPRWLPGRLELVAAMLA